MYIHQSDGRFFINLFFLDGTGLYDLTKLVFLLSFLFILFFFLLSSKRTGLAFFLGIIGMDIPFEKYLLTWGGNEA